MNSSGKQSHHPLFFPKFEPEKQTIDSGHSRHILYLPRWYPSKADPMFGLFVRKHALAAVAAGFRVTVVYVVPDLTVKSHELFSTQISTQEGLTEIIVSYRRADGLSGMVRQLIAWNLGIKNAVRLNGKPQLIHAHVLTRTALLAWWFGRKWKIPYLITEHWSRYFPENLQYKGLLRKLLTRFAVRKATGLTVVSSRLAGSMKQAGLGDDFSILPNVVDTRLFNILETESLKTRIISITCFEEKSKNLKLLADAFVSVLSERPDAELVLVGEGADLQMIREYVSSKKLPPGSVRFTGLLENEALARELQQSACLALTSNYETFGIVAYEAMACGVPVVATDVADLADFVEPNSGRISPVGDAALFSGALLEVLSEQKQFNRTEMRNRVVQQYGFEAVSRYLEKLYLDLISRDRK
ncbi:MAG: glycosyltransferase [Bacteroidales bacterium]|nr:glycosyltransferase [Bacteroidales bacterium]